MGLSVEIQTHIFDDVVSFIVRRAMCGLTTKNYNNVFLLLLKSLEVPLDVDHILPEKWYAHWPLDGRTISEEEAASAAALSFGLENPTPQVQAIITREELKATIGNLTLVHYGINRSLQNGPFPSKSKAFFAESNLQLNRPLMVADHWDEATILERGNDLFEVARLIWRGPAPPVKL